jgi:hypothetical protein
MKKIENLILITYYYLKIMMIKRVVEYTFNVSYRESLSLNVASNLDYVRFIDILSRSVGGDDFRKSDPINYPAILPEKYKYLWDYTYERACGYEFRAMILHCLMYDFFTEEFLANAHYLILSGELNEWFCSKITTNVMTF